MKFKLIFLIFNAIVVFSFLFIALLPVFMLGWEYAAPFWENSWYLLLLFVLVLFGLDAYFIRNWKMFTLLEQKDWELIQKYLEEEIFSKKRIGDQRVQILLNTYVVKGRPDSMIRLAEWVRNENPGVYRRLLLPLSTGHLLNNDFQGLKEYYDPWIQENSLTKKGWADWLWAFAALRLQEGEAPLSRLTFTAQKSNDEAVRLLSAYLLKDILQLEISEKTRDFLSGFASRYSKAAWAKKLEGRKEKLHILTLSSILQQAGEWCIANYAYTADIPVASPAAAQEQGSSDEQEDSHV
ncbi:hypothetical protein [Salinispira pacifica]|uniref:Uncharacterized protein n=1 Tax=Salinispira pacifica TaxID=1307761 RepID=V5WGV1_9SPIO|nr:hypothetical protein [Salinispira pacifica]AHC14794.1 hypothetical protein L21SP2_1395 [Salinispira pacifica]